MINPDEIPQYTGNLELLEQDYAALKADAGHVRDTGRDVHNRFQGLSAYYTAPEAEQLFATTKPVKDRADTFADGLETVSSALAGYATEIRPLAKKLEDLKREATTFVDSVKDDHDWKYDHDKVAHHNRIRDEVTKTVAAFWAAERTCHNKITALWHGTQMVAGDGSKKANQYGFNAEDLKNAKLPWGDPVEEKHHWWEVGHWVKSFVWDGIIVDSVWGTIKGLGTLVGFGGWDAMGQAWKGLAQLATGLVISSLPGAQAMFWGLPDDKLPSWLRDSRRAMKETGKALVAWDEWGKNPARAAGAVTFNVVTTVFTGGAGAAAADAGKAGAVAKALSVAGKAGKVIDPMTYVAKGVGAGLSKIGDIAKGLKGIGKIDIPTLPDSAAHLPEGTVQLTDGHLMDPNGNIMSSNGTIETTPATHQPAAPKLPDHWTVQGHQPTYTGAPQTAGSGIHGGIPHTVSNSGYGGMPTTGHGIHGGIPHSMDASVHTGPTHVPADGIHGGIPHGTGDPIPAGGHYDTIGPASYDHTPVSTPAHDAPVGPSHGTSPGVPHLPHEPQVPSPHTGGHDFSGGSGHDPNAAPHETPGGHTDGTSHGAGHDGHGAGHDGGHSAHDGGHHTGHPDDAAHAGDHLDGGDTAVDVAAHHGTDAPVAPGHERTDVPGHSGADEPFEYKPHMSVDDFNQLSTDAEKHAVATAELTHGTNPAPSVSDKAGQAYGDAYWNDFLDNLDPSGREALHTYSDHYYKQINGHLRGDYPDVSPKISHTIDEMDRVMGDRPVPESIMVIRGTGIDHLNLKSPLEMMGNIYDDPGYTSTALGKTVPGPFSYKPVYMHLRVPKGTPALWIDHVSANPGERELLLARGTEYRVTRVFMDQSGKWHVYGEVLPRP
ncbi:ADP-ribosyltransferase [Streptomyces mexicanus]|uniref:Protein phosphatase n=1 Tax=Streptomyces mexicanus TaxID=178566 RepID=A0A7X1HV60_9ACTN|nr:ADP-ribosyltransferase [Streptomyces mexicanus]MBC2863742.1 protein phosphatase [Streptomyces mexicanus]